MAHEAKTDPAARDTVRAQRIPRELPDVDEYDKQLRRCLTDEALPRELRIVGALIRLYAPPIVRIKELTTSHVHQNDAGAFLTIDRHPVLLPPTLARLIKAHIASPQASLMLKTRASSGPDYLFPGRHAGRPLSASHIIKRLRNHDLPTRAGRNTASPCGRGQLGCGKPRLGGGSVPRRGPEARLGGRRGGCGPTRPSPRCGQVACLQTKSDVVAGDPAFKVGLATGGKGQVLTREPVQGIDGRPQMLPRPGAGSA